MVFSFQAILKFCLSCRFFDLDIVFVNVYTSCVKTLLIYGRDEPAGENDAGIT